MPGVSFELRPSVSLVYLVEHELDAEWWGDLPPASSRF